MADDSDYTVPCVCGGQLHLLNGVQQPHAHRTGSSQARAERSLEDARDVGAEVELNVSLHDHGDYFEVARLTLSIPGGFNVDPRFPFGPQLAAQLEGLGEKAGVTLDQIVQETAWGE